MASKGGHPSGQVTGLSGPALRTGPWLGGTCVTLSTLLDPSISFLISETRERLPAEVWGLSEIICVKRLA